MKKTRLILVIMLCVSMLLFVGIIDSSSENVEYKYDEQIALIEHMIDCMNSGDWEGWAQCYAEEFRDDRQAFIGEALNYALNIGVLTVKHAEIIEINHVDNEIILKDCPKLESYAAEGRLECYSIKLDIEVVAANDYFTDGETTQLAGLVNVDGKWFVGAMIRLPDDNNTEPSMEAGQPKNRVAAIKNSMYSNLMLYFSSEERDGADRITVEFGMPSRKKFLANSSGVININIPYLLEWRLDSTTDHSVYYINDGTGEIVGAIGYTLCNSKLYGESLLNEYSSTETLSKLDAYNDVFLQEFPQEKYSCLELNSYFIEVVKTDNETGNITAITRSNPWALYVDEDGNALRKGKECVVIMSYEPTFGVIIVIELNPVYFTGMEIMDIAASLKVF